MAEVWAARAEGPEGFVKAVALKFVVDSGDPDMELLFVNEARVAAQLQHPNLVTVFDFDRIVDATEFGSPGRYYIAMERVEGHDLRRVLQHTREHQIRLPVQLSLYVAAEVLQGLRYVHERPPVSAMRAPVLVHRDVSPHNILVAFSGDVKLSDFGIAKVVGRAAGTPTGLVRGKLAYASPEQVRGGLIDPRADQFSLGVTLWELLADRRLFAGKSESETMRRVLEGVVPPLPAELGIGPEVELVVRRMLEPDPERRFPTTAAALSSLMGLRDYSGDGTLLGAWMVSRFAPGNFSSSPLPRTQELPALGVGGGAGPVAVAGSTLLLEDSRGDFPWTPPSRTPPSRTPPSRTPLPPPGGAGAVARSGRIRGGADTGATPVIDFATRAPLRARGPVSLRLGLFAAVVALAAWGAVISVRLPDSVTAPRPRGAVGDNDVPGDVGNAGRPNQVPIAVEPARSAEPAQPEPRTQPESETAAASGATAAAAAAAADPTTFESEGNTSIAEATRQFQFTYGEGANFPDHSYGPAENDWQSIPPTDAPPRASGVGRERSANGAPIIE